LIYSTFYKYKTINEYYRSVIISPKHRYKDLKIYYPDEVLSEIIFGYKTPEEDIQKVINLIKYNYTISSIIHYYRAIPNRNKMQLELKELT